MSVSKHEAILDSLDLVVMSKVKTVGLPANELLAVVRTYDHWSEYKVNALRQRLMRLNEFGLLAIEEVKRGKNRLLFKATEQGRKTLRNSLSFYRSV